MTVTMRPTVTCDDCGRSWPGREGQNAFDLRAEVNHHGWSNDQKEDHCPDCTVLRYGR